MKDENDFSSDEIIEVFNELSQRYVALQIELIKQKHKHLLHLIDERNLDEIENMLADITAENQSLKEKIEQEKYQDMYIDEIIERLKEEEELKRMIKL
jgi:hypothetical protein